MKPFAETVKTECFVAPELCSHLMMAGLYPDTAFKWRIYRDEVKLTTFIYDEDDYYADSVKNLDYMRPPELTIPGYSLTDVEKILPKGYFLTLNDDSNYEISLSKDYNLESCKADRLPDVYAKMLLQCLRKRVMDIRKINSFLAK